MFNAVRNWLSFRDCSETEGWEWYDGKPCKLRADVEQSGADELTLLEQTDELNWRCFDRKLESYSETKII